MRNYSRMNPEDPVAQGFWKFILWLKAGQIYKKKKSSRRWKYGANSQWRPSCGRLRRCMSGRQMREKQRAKLTVFTVDQVVRQRARDRGIKLSGTGWKGEEERQRNGRQENLFCSLNPSRNSLWEDVLSVAGPAASNRSIQSGRMRWDCLLL